MCEICDSIAYSARQAETMNPLPGLLRVIVSRAGLHARSTCSQPDQLRGAPFRRSRCRLALLLLAALPLIVRHGD